MKNKNPQSARFHNLHEWVHIGIMVAATIILGVVMSIMQPRFLNAGVNDAVSGWAWIGVQGGGWISLNCTNTGSCGAADYGVDIDSAGSWSGSGWSSNIGWIDFDGGSCGAGTFTNLTTGATSGWAHARSFTASQGGFSGCIDMSGGGLGGVTVDMVTGDVDGYAWSGDDVEADIDNDGTLDWVLDGSADVGLGWIDFSYALVDIELVIEDELGTVDLMQDGFSGMCGDEATFTWSLEDVDESACELTVEDVVANEVIETIPMDAAALSEYSYTIDGFYRFVLTCPNIEQPPVDISSSPIEISCSDQPLECNDNTDNDGDNDVDYNDPSCHDQCEVTSSGTYNPAYSESRTCTGSDACLDNPESPLCLGSGGVPPIVIEN